MPAKNITLYAKWLNSLCTITLVYNAGIQRNETFNCECNSNTELPKTEIDGYSFNGWYLTDESKLITEYNPSKNGTAIYSKYTVNNYTVFFDTDGGTLIEDRSYNFSSYVDLPGAEKEGHEFVCWVNTESNETVTTISAMPANDVYLSAIFVPNNYTITFDTNNIVDVPAEAFEFGAFVTLPTPKAPFYTFEYWVDADENEVDSMMMPAGNITLWGVFTPYKFMISFETNNITDLEPLEVDFGGEINISYVVEDEEYSFGGWYMDSDFKELFNFSIMPNYSFTLYAKWEEPTKYIQIVYDTKSFSDDDINLISSYYETKVMSIEKVDNKIYVILEFKDTKDAKSFFDGYKRDPSTQ